MRRHDNADFSRFISIAGIRTVAAARGHTGVREAAANLDVVDALYTDSKLM